MIWIAAALLIILALGAIVIRTIIFSRKASPAEKTSGDIIVRPSAVQHLAEAVRFETVSNHDSSQTDWGAFRAFQSWLEETYPLSHKTMRLQRISFYTLHYTWEGSDDTLEPILLTAHQDVVPAGELSGWKHPPFNGEVDGGYLWGRGTLDVKNQIICIFEAAEELLREGFRPKRSIHLCFGHDEEIGGFEGAAVAADLFVDEGLSFSMVLDEGGAVTEDMLEGIDRPIATIGIGEKGYMDLDIHCESPGGHASMPLKQTSLSRLAGAIYTIQNKQPHTRLTEAPKQMFLALGPYMGLTNRIVIANLWLFRPLFLKIMEKSPASNAMIRTTFAATMAKGSSAPNVLPAEADGLINVRLLHGDSPDEVLSYVKGIVNDDQLSFSASRAEGPSSLSPTDNQEFARLTGCVAQVFPDAVISPYLMVGGSDARKYERSSRAIYRFSPYQLTAEELGTMHSYDERISLENIYRGVAFYREVIRSFTGRIPRED